jgi:flagellar protein FliO/FliZ
MDSPLTSILWFLFVIALIPLALWLFKRTPMARAMQGQSMRVVGVLPLSGSQRVVTVEVGQGSERRWLVLGVAPSSVSLLHTLPPQDESAAPPAPERPFAAMLAGLRGRDSERQP